MSSEPHQDGDARRIRRKPPPPFPYSPRYPEPDPSDPFASLSVLRDRTATLTNPPYESPVAIPDHNPGSSKMLDLSTFIIRQRNKSAALGEGSWQGHVSQLRKGASMGLGLNEFSPSTEFPATATITSSSLRQGGREMHRREARRRSQSVFALRSGTFSFIESRAGSEAQLNMESTQSTRLHSLSPYGSRSSVLSSSSTSSEGSTHGERKANGSPARPRSCSSSFVSATLLDGLPENVSDGVPLLKSMHVMHVDMPPHRVADKGLEDPPHLPPKSLEKRIPSVSSIDSWSRDAAFYSAPSRPQTPSSIRSSRPVSLPPSSVLSFPSVHPPSKPVPFTTSPLTTSTHHAASIPSTLATSLPRCISNSRRVSCPPEDLDALPIQLHFRFPKHEQSAESEPESVERDSGRFARLRARTSAAFQTRRSSTSSSLRSTLRAAAEAADKLAAEAASITAPSTVTAPPKVSQAPVAMSEIAKTISLTAGTPLEVEQPKEVQRMGSQTGGPGYDTDQPAPTPSVSHTYPPQNADDVLSVSRTQVTADLTQRSPPKKTDVKTEPESTPPLKRRSASRGSHKTTARRSSSTPLPLSRPLPSPPTVTTHPGPVVKLSPIPPPRAHLSHPQVQRFALAPTPSMQGEPPLGSQAVYVVPPAISYLTLSAGAAPPHVIHEPTLPLPPIAHRRPSSQTNHLPQPRPPPRSVQTYPIPSHMAHPFASNIMRSSSSNSSRGDNISMASAPQVRRRDVSPSSSHGRQGSLLEPQGHHHRHHPHHPGYPRSLSEPGITESLSSAQLMQAACLPVVRENGLRLQFGELWRTQRTVVIFIRHFWYFCFFVESYVDDINCVASLRCPMCQDYLASVMRDVDHAALARSGVRLVVIGCGSYGLIRSYRRTRTFIISETASI